MGCLPFLADLLIRTDHPSVRTPRHSACLIAAAQADGGHAQEYADGRGRKRDAVFDQGGDGEVVGGPVLLVDDVDLLVVGSHGVDPAEVGAGSDHVGPFAGDPDMGEQDLLFGIDDLDEAGVGVGGIGIGAIDG